MKSLDFELGKLQAELERRLEGIATDTDNTTDTVRERLSDLLRSDGINPIPTAKPYQRYHVVGGVKDWHREAIKLRKQGLSYRQIAKKVGHPPQSLTLVMRKAGLAGKPAKAKGVDWKAEAIRLRKAGKYPSSIAARLRLSKSSVFNVLSKAGLTRVVKNPWAGMTPEQRSAEMKRRQEVAKAKSKTGG